MTLPSPADEVVVLVDDDIVTLRLLEHVLQDLPGSRTVSFLNPEEALRWCSAKEADLVLTDIEMPEMSGLELLGHLRGSERTADVPVIMITSLDDADARIRALTLGASDYIIKPFNAVEVKVRAGNLLALRRTSQALADRMGWLTREVTRATAGILGREREIVLRLARAAEHRDWETGAHIVRIGQYARILADALGLPTDDVDAISWSAPMHDVGKIAIPDYVLLKPGTLDDSEFTVMKQHTTYGRQILGGSDIPLLRLAAEIAWTHHERFDGTGYPRGVSGENIPLAGRIVAVVDVFDALTSNRPYKRAWDVASAIAYLQAGPGKPFDPRCVEAFVARLDDVLAVREQHEDHHLPPALALDNR